MQIPSTLLLLIPSLAVVLADTTTCGDRTYSSDAVSDAVDKACDLFKANTTVGDDSLGRYPTSFSNFNNLNLDGTIPPYQSFPIVENKTYEGGPPGVDRVVITANCTTAGVITNQGAQGNSFLLCSKKTDGDKPGLASLATVSKSLLGLSAGAAIYISLA